MLVCAVQDYPNSIEYIQKNRITNEIAKIAISHKWSNIQYVSSKTLKVRSIRDLAIKTYQKHIEENPDPKMETCPKKGFKAQLKNRNRKHDEINFSDYIQI